MFHHHCLSESKVPDLGSLDIKLQRRSEYRHLARIHPAVSPWLCAQPDGDPLLADGMRLWRSYFQQPDRHPCTFLNLETLTIDSSTPVIGEATHTVPLKALQILNIYDYSTSIPYPALTTQDCSRDRVESPHDEPRTIPGVRDQHALPVAARTTPFAVCTAEHVYVRLPFRIGRRIDNTSRRRVPSLPSLERVCRPRQVQRLHLDHMVAPS
ncbi:hypothetical protein OH76DRAFT_1403683 [Lentinus brumalis]|uniref:Uncharacterized protein n=1 Tax=Lentinus brumalis TaxID=2498619 RepID=A0A371DAA1_9APHY|nr:hypothetical protein OH76DRAFT_1403683 [Polyporus brumalis]